MDRKAEYERIGRERQLAEREAQSVTRRALLRASLEIVVSCLAGLCIMFFAWHVDDPVLGKAFLWGGMAVGYAGMAFAILSAYRRGVERGDW
ncbi:MAG TPA: hypothetical protein VJ867_16740 [Gemmatimonadaceae bacterium]|nr:hypothetical protein [Gemmatimonadaceae bacterium]